MYFSRDKAEGAPEEMVTRVEGRLGFSGLQNRMLRWDKPRPENPTGSAGPSHWALALCFCLLCFHHSLCGSTS